LSRTLRVGILQFGSYPSKRANLEKIFLLIKKVEADIVVLPEYSMFTLSGRTPEEVYRESEDLEGPFVSEFKRFAKEFSTYVLVTFFEKARYPRVYNTVVVLSPREEVVAVYRKLHLFDSLGYRESEYVTPGNTPSKVFEVRSCRAAIAVCFDLRFPEVFRHYALQGAEVVFVPSAWYSGPFKEETLEFLARSRASENVYYVVVSNQFGPTFTGKSMVVDPLGVVLLNLGIGEKYVEYEVDVDYVYEARRVLPLLSLRREDVYSLRLNFDYS